MELNLGFQAHPAQGLRGQELDLGLAGSVFFKWFKILSN